VSASSHVESGEAFATVKVTISGTGSPRLIVPAKQMSLTMLNFDYNREK